MEAPVISGSIATMRRALILFAETALRPLIRILLRYGLTYPEFNQIARKLFVDVAMNEAEFFIPRRQVQHKARVACLTGLSRKEVLRLLESARPADDAGLRSSNRAARVLAGWLSDIRYTDDRGHPLPLPFVAADGRRSFSELVATYSGDIPPRAILDELKRTGTCMASSDDEIRVCRHTYLARPVDVEELASAAMRLAADMAKLDDALLARELRSAEPPVATHVNRALL